MKLYVVGFGCGSHENMTFEADAAIQKSDLIVGYTTYVELIKRLYPDKNFESTGMRHERERVQFALENADEGLTVSLICSGDCGVYGMAGLAIEIAEKSFPNVDVEIISGVTAALSGGAILGAPLTHDFAVISLSDLLTPMDKIEKRLKLAAEADFTIILYNPSSKKRKDYCARACDLLLEIKSADTVCGFVKNIGRNGQESGVMTLEELRNFPADMFTTLFIGNSETRKIGNKMVTPRGYRNG